MVRIMWRFAILSTAFLWSAGLAMAQQIEGLHGEAALAIEADIRAGGFMSPVESHVFYGDLSGRGTNDAVALLYHPTGGNSDQITQWLYWDTGDGYSRAASSPLEDVYGIDPRDAKLSPGRVEITMTVMNPGDPRCCPTGEKTYVLAVGRSGQALAAPAAGGGAWNATQTADPIGVNVEAVSADGRARITGGCTTEFLDPGFWLTFHNDGDALERTHQKAELLLLEITSCSDVQYFTASTIYEGPGDSWVAERPLSEDFLNAFAAGNEMTVSGGGGDGGTIARFGLRGTADAVTMMREVCGPAAIAAAVDPVALPFADGRYRGAARR